jgi:hypothetical protein
MWSKQNQKHMMLGFSSLGKQQQTRGFAKELLKLCFEALPKP